MFTNIQQSVVPENGLDDLLGNGVRWSDRRGAEKGTVSDGSTGTPATM